MIRESGAPLALSLRNFQQRCAEDFLYPFQGTSSPEAIGHLLGKGSSARANLEC